MKKISFDEMANLMGGYTSCAQVQYAANTHVAPFNPSPAEQSAEDAFWEYWLSEFDRWCR